MVVSTNPFYSIFLIYGIMLIWHVMKSVSNSARESYVTSTRTEVKSSTSKAKSNSDPWGLIKIPLRNERFEEGNLHVVISEYDEESKTYHALIAGSFEPEFDVYADSIKELEDKIDAEYVRIMDSYKDITGYNYLRLKGDKTVIGWKDGRTYVHTILK